MKPIRSTPLLALALVTACAGSSAPSQATSDSAASAAAPVAYTIDSDPQDSVIFEQRMSLSKSQRMDTLPIGEIVVRMGRTFVGAPYIPGSLEAPGTEHLVVNLRSFDCVTFVENSLALARTIRDHGDYHHFQRELVHIRYRAGRLGEYPSRLHYFSDWIADNERKGIMRNMTRDLGGAADPEPIRFMTSHVPSYRQLSDTAFVRTIAAQEQQLTRAGHFVLPEGAIAGAAARIQNGDVIAAATTVPGLDIAHTGIALWENGQLRLMHAPLVGTMVQISETTIADRIIAAKTQDGIMVARPR
ncbi:MAG: N-acetylmuramoyl-L-alanine amidase-like domain-containing protein [Longimicrobiales bacterium]